MDESELVARFNNNDRDAFEIVFKSCYDGLLLYALSMNTSEPLAEDSVIEAFVKIWKAEKAYNDLHHIKATLYRALKQIQLNHLGSESKRTDREQYYVSHQDGYERHHFEKMVYAEVISSLHAAIEKLPEPLNRIIKLSTVDGYSNAEIADMLSIKQQTVKNYKAKAIKLLQNQLRYNLAFLIFIKLIEK